jgi:hypothetical protein
MSLDIHCVPRIFAEECEMAGRRWRVSGVEIHIQITSPAASGQNQPHPGRIHQGLKFVSHDYHDLRPKAVVDAAQPM